MRAPLALFLNWLHQVGLAAWMGGILTLGALGAPAVFRQAKAMGHTQRGMPLYDFAGYAVGSFFERFSYVTVAAAVVMLVTGVAYGLLSGLCRKLLLGRAALTVLAGGVAGWLAFGLFPAMTAARAAGSMELFDRMHRTSTTAFQAQLWVLLAVAALTAWLHLHEAPGLPSLRPAEKYL